MSGASQTLPAKQSEFLLEPDDSQRLSALCGPFDGNLRQIELRLGIEIRNRGNRFALQGPAPAVNSGEAVLRALYQQAEGAHLSKESVHLALNEQLAASDTGNQADTTESGELLIRTKRGVVKGRSPHQRAYLQQIADHDLTFGVGPAGTGKTYLAVASAVHALERDRVRRIVLVRPAVEAGEKLGFLPGDMADKINPYLRPLYDALYEMLGFERVAKLSERSVIEVAPLAFMRGRTLNDAFVILDEAQNTTLEQMKTFLTRIGFGSAAVVTGDVTQIDLPRHERSGLKHALDVVAPLPGVAVTHFAPSDVVRHPLVQAIVQAYEAHDAKAAARGETGLRR